MAVNGNPRGGKWWSTLSLLVGVLLNLGNLLGFTNQMVTQPINPPVMPQTFIPEVNAPSFNSPANPPFSIPSNFPLNMPLTLPSNIPLNLPFNLQAAPQPSEPAPPQEPTVPPSQVPTGFFWTG